MNNTNILNSIKKASSIIANEQSRAALLAEIDGAINELQKARAQIAGNSFGVSNSLGGDIGAQYRAGYEPMPE
ncbi:hypothetical protein OB952_20805 [Aeromonas salmonicida]|uniref:hypothetical protein n=1 Tax=Aeromonas salmonicida TaxID=645 RepID=UPI00259D9D52|nr:hypothetical protein [Aeromonas salmonicida]MDM5069779.1 hypothetical protein [Aeromonas salmonicida]